MAMQTNYTAKAALVAQQRRIDVIANNMANINTTGYKTVRADFKDNLYSTMTRNVQPQDDVNLLRGSGTQLGATVRDFRNGINLLTGLPNNFLIDGRGFFTVNDIAGEKAYTRNGEFQISSEGESTYITTPTGLYVLDESGQKIDTKGYAFTQLIVQSDGTIQHLDEATGQFETLGKFGIASFTNLQGLEAGGGSLFYETENSGAATPDPTSVIHQSALENSNVDIAVEMTRVIRAQRAFSLASRALTTADEMDGTANQLYR